MLRGEGPLSLARAFFQAGAHAVIGSLWEVRDDESAAFFSAFYGALGRGRPIAEALAEARRERLRAGAPAAAWAGFTLMGDLGRRRRGGARRSRNGLALGLAPHQLSQTAFALRRSISTQSGLRGGSNAAYSSRCSGCTRPLHERWSGCGPADRV